MMLNRIITIKIKNGIQITIGPGYSKWVLILVSSAAFWILLKCRFSDPIPPFEFQSALRNVLM